MRADVLKTKEDKSECFLNGAVAVRLAKSRVNKKKKNPIKTSRYKRTVILSVRESDRGGGGAHHCQRTRVQHHQRMQSNKSEVMGKAREAETHCSSPRLSCLRSRSGCHTSSGLECSCYSRSGIHEVRRSFHLFHQEQTNTKMKMASKSMNINTLLAIIFSRCNHCFLRVSLNNSDLQFKTQNSLQRLMRCKMKYLPVLPIILQSL